MSLLGPDLGTVVTRVCPLSFERAVPVLSIINEVKTFVLFCFYVIY